MKFFLALALCFLACAHAKEIGVRRYDGYQVFSVTADSKEKYQALWDVYMNNEGVLDFWTEPVINGRTDVMVPPQEENVFKLMLEKNGMTYEVKIPDVQVLIDEEKEANDEAKLRSGTGRISWTQYSTYAEIETFVKELPSINSIASIQTIGKSTENRDLYAIKISTSPNNRKAILIDANIHAREWITSATATWIINELVTKTSSYGDVLDGIDYYFIPSINVDGYEFSRTSDRMWRKTRSVNAGSTCRGCDPNRNFPYKFGGEGTSASPCSDTFKGPSALSEPETKAVADYIARLQSSNVNIVAYLSFHSYGQYWLLPWGYTAGAYPPDYSQQLSLGNAAIAAIREVHGTRYITGTGADVLYGVGGASDDYAKSEGIKYTVTVEMRDEGRYGFVLPPAQIIPNAEETMAAVKVVAARVRSE